ncbi:acyltransferase [Mesorhizobium sp. M0213]|uniref:acyltransferase family protein n=1 Tax=unclassified Mesorhizobium TaxID=325217 RepID=UPI0033366047
MNIIPQNDHASPRRIQQYTSVQILRGLAALMVVIFHLPAALGMLDLDIPVLNSGVDLFFIISGFVMVLSTENRRPDHRAFLMQRFTRVVPFYWIMTFLMVAALWLIAGRAVSLEQTTNSLLFIPYLDTVTGYVQPVLGVGWTLNLEILFYILFAATMSFGKWTQMAAVGVVFAIAVAVRIIFKPAADTVLFFYTTPILFEFLAGMALGHLVGRLTRLPAVLGASALVFAIMSMLVMVLGFNLPRTLAQGLPALILVAACIRLESYFRLFAPRVLARLGDASYSLYLTHPIVLLATAPVVASANVSPWLAGMVLVAACIAVSLASYSFIEKPLLAISRMSLSAYQVKAQ